MWIIFFVIFVVLFIAAWIQPRSEAVPQEDVSPMSSEVSLPTSREENVDLMQKKGSGFIFVENQSVGKEIVIIQRVEFIRPGFVIVRKSVAGVPAEQIGTSELLEGTQENVVIDLTESLQSDQVYAAQMVADNGDGLFQEGKDLLISNDEQIVLMMSFIAE